ncbi:MAG: recombinase zinc beta ribbon domain-containing protein, partial [Lachnospiraceae bacterium]
LFDATLIRKIIKNPVYCGKIAYGRRKTEKVHGTRNDYHLVEQEEYILVDGIHAPIVSEDIWKSAQVKVVAQAKKYEHVNKTKDERTHLLSGIVKCPLCGAGMYGNKSIKYRSDGIKYKDFYYYGCKHRNMSRGHKCTYRKQINEELLDSAVAEVIIKLVSNPRFASMMHEKINTQVDTTEIEQEVANYEKQLRQTYATKGNLTEEIDSLDAEDKHYSRRKSDLDDRLYKMYDKIEALESQLIEARAKRSAIESEKITGDNIYKVLIYFEKLYTVMNEVEKRQLIEAFISEVQVFEERQPSGQWLKSIKFKLPIIEEDVSIGLDNETHVETVVLLSHKKPDSHINVKVEFGEGEGKVPLDSISKRAENYKPKERVTYKMIKKYVEEKHGFKVHTAYIAEVKRDLGLLMYDAPNAVEELKNPRKHPTPVQVDAIKDALKYFEVI